MRLIALQLGRLAVRQRSVLHSVADARFLLDIALNIGLHALRRHAVRIADRAVVGVARDVLAQTVLRVLDLRLLLRRHAAVALGVLAGGVSSWLGHVAEHVALELQSLVGCLGSTLSPLEADALRLYLDGASYESMAEELGCDTKTIDNALQRVKRKILTHQRERQVLQ